MILVICSSGLVGSCFLELCNKKEEIITPSETELDILKPETIQKVLDQYHPQVVINFAAHTNLEEAEKLRGDKSGLPWQLNVEGAKSIANICQQEGIFLIHISTDAVFPGTDDLPGPYSEDIIPPNNLKPLSWYGYTKLQGEEAVKNSGARSAIVRITYPFGNPNSDRDFANKTLNYVKAGYSLFNDQYFTPTYIPDLTKALLAIAHHQQEGIYHVACDGLTTPYDFGKYLASSSKLNIEIKAGSAIEFLKTPGRPARVIKGGLSTKQTEKSLNIFFSKWKAAIDSFLQKH